jgi:branched-chain amino acid transport system permease protein
MTYEILLIVVIGGIGSITGSCLASFLFIAASEWWMRFLDNEAVLNTGSALAFTAVIVAVVCFIIWKVRARNAKTSKLATWLSIAGGGGIIAYAVYLCARVLAEGSAKLPLLRSGFRMVVFSIVIMCVVLFYRQGIMGTREFSVAGVLRLWDKLKAKLRRKGKAV